MIRHFCSVSVIAFLDNDEKERFKQDVRTVVNKHGVISKTHQVVVPFYTALYFTGKIESELNDISFNVHCML